MKKSMQGILVIIFLFMFSFMGNAEVSTVFRVIGEYGEGGWIPPYCALPLTDGSLFIGSTKVADNGKVNSTNTPAQDGWGILINENGAVVKETIISSDATLGAYISIRQAFESDGRLTLLIHNESPREEYVVVLEQDGKQKRTDAFQDEEVFISDSVSTSQGILVSGQKDYKGISSLWIALVGGTGNLLWEYTRPLAREDSNRYIKICAADDHSITALISTPYPVSNMLLILDTDGNEVSSTEITLDTSNIDIQGMATKDGFTYLFGAANKRYSSNGWAACVDDKGTVIWQNEYAAYEYLRAPLIIDTVIICAAKGKDFDTNIAILDSNGMMDEEINTNTHFKVISIVPASDQFAWIVGQKSASNGAAESIVAGLLAFHK